MSSSYHANLLQEVSNLSENKKWADAVLEWNITDCDEDEALESSCVCGKENLRYLFTIKNTLNNNTLYPIGSSCIKKFNRADLNEKTSIQEKLFKLFHAVEDDSFISLSKNFFSRKLLEYLYNQGALKSTSFNNFDPQRDYDFLLKMFNKRNKDEITSNQQKKINAIIITSIRPYLYEQLSSKIKNNHT